MKGENAPRASNLDTWLEMHPNFQVAPRTESDEEEVCVKVNILLSHL